MTEASEIVGCPPGRRHRGGSRHDRAPADPSDAIPARLAIWTRPGPGRPTRLARALLWPGPRPPGRSRIDPAAFPLAFLLAPVLGTLPVFAVPPFGWFVLAAGVPAYLTLGGPALWIWLNRHPPAVGPIARLAGRVQVISTLAAITISTVLAALWHVDWLTVVVLLIFYGLAGVPVALLWATIFALIYRRLGTDPIGRIPRGNEFDSLHQGRPPRPSSPPNHQSYQ